VRRGGGEARQKTDHALGEFRGAVGGNIGPGLRFIVVEHMPLSSRQTRGGPDGHVKSRPVLPETIGTRVSEPDKRSRVEKERRTQHDTAEAVGIRCRELGDVARELRRSMLA
jgi:hypothetical protein